MDASQALSLILHQGAQLLLIPVIVALVALVVIAVFCIGFIIVEYFTERRYFKANHRQVIAQMRDADPRELSQVIERAALLRRQIASLTHIAQNMGLPDDELFAMAEVEMSQVDSVYERRVNLTDTIAKVAPMLGLMGTLIPLGPGIVAMGQGDVSQLSSSLLIAFDTTIAGLVVAVIALVISRIRKTWYGQYHTMVQALMGCILEEAALARENGVALPYGGEAEAPEMPVRVASKDASELHVGEDASSAAPETPARGFEADTPADGEVAS